MRYYDGFLTRDAKARAQHQNHAPTVISVLVEKQVFQPIRELCEEKRTVVGVGIGQKA